jgi:endogenous inhibitor of DNA gyrase (YacG/DUF329 family)
LKGKGHTAYKCQHCEKEFFAAKSQNRKFCSKECVGKQKQSVWSPAFSTVRKVMLKRNMINECARCQYDSEPRILGVHHKDRNRLNNALENLEVLCPNCHSIEHLRHTPHGFTE